MVDPVFEHPRLVTIYDAVEPDRTDLDAYTEIAAELGARRLLDVGCGTGVFALRMAALGMHVVGVDPAAGSLAVARAKPGAERVRWIHGDATALPPLQVDLATMTGNVAQAITNPATWAATLHGIHTALRPGGHLAVETRDPAAEAWRHWNPATTHQTHHLPDVGTVEHWLELTAIDGPLISFRHHYRFASDSAVLTSQSTLRFRHRDELHTDLHTAGLIVTDIRDAPDRPGLELVFLAQHPD
jgi:SAM-dependent methyltransferase